MIEYYKMIEERQKLPLMIYQCGPYTDKEILTEETIKLERLKKKVTNRLLAITSRQPNIQNLLNSSEWTAKSAKHFSFEIFTIIRFEPIFHPHYDEQHGIKHIENLNQHRLLEDIASELTGNSGYRP